MGLVQHQGDLTDSTIVSRVLVTGASGFVGRTLCGVLSNAGYRVRAAVRDPTRAPPNAAETVTVGDLGPDTAWQDALAGAELAIHLAARAHVMNDRGNEDAYLRANARGTLNFAAQCAAAGVRRLVFLSSVKVNGEATAERPFSALDLPKPQDPYGVSKYEGEKFALQVGEQSGMEVAIVRAPLMYGPGVKANFARLMRWVDQERLLPLGAVANRRSLLSLWNLCDLLGVLLTHAEAPGRVWMASDGEDVSTPELIRRLAGAMNRRARLIPVPLGLLRALGSVLGRRAEVTRLCGSLTVDLSTTRELLEWSPPMSLDEGLERTAAWYRSAGVASGL
jgi:UDP-glucose 4-epimerase